MMILSAASDDWRIREGVRNQVVDPWATVYATGADPGPESTFGKTMDALRALVLAAMVLVVALAVVGLVIAIADQVSERRRLFANLAAFGVPRRVLSRSVAYASLGPALISIGLAVVVGLLLRFSFAAVTSGAGVGSWDFLVGVVIAAAVVLLTATAAAVLAVRGAARSDNLRFE